MISGDCPYCDAPTHNWLAEDMRLPGVELCVCDECGKEYWLLHSRLYPEAARKEDWEPEKAWPGEYSEWAKAFQKARAGVE